MPSVFPIKGQPGTIGLFMKELTGLAENFTALTRQADTMIANISVRHMIVGSMPMKHGLPVLSNFTSLRQ